MAIPYEILSVYGIQFKQLISGPAPVGRVLNYLKLIGNNKLKHKNGNRDLNLTNDIGSAWCTEFMVGLGLTTYVELPGTNVYPLYLTLDGSKLFDKIKNSKSFDESRNPRRAKDELLNYSRIAYNQLKEIFIKSPIYKNLFAYIINTQKNVFDKQGFYDEYFGFFKKYYTGEDYVINYNSNAATTGSNRVPSLVQFCMFFDLAQEKNGKIIFSISNDVPKTGGFVAITPDIQKDIQKEEKYNEIITRDLEEKYGIDGIVAREVVTRNNNVQRIFRNNLIFKYGLPCAVCNKDLDDVLIASHIKPAAICDVNEKADCENGLMLCALHDRLFDRLLITFDANDGKLKYASVLKDKLEDYQLRSDFYLNSKFLTNERKRYLKWHNDKFKEKNGY